MESTRGRGRALSDAQVQRVLIWNTRVRVWKEQRRQVPTLRAFARANRVDEKTLRRWLPGIDEKIRLLVRVRDWGRADAKLRVARSQIETLRGLAQEFGVPHGTVEHAARRGGVYKQAPPERIAEVRARRRAQLERLRRMNLY